MTGDDATRIDLKLRQPLRDPAAEAVRRQPGVALVSPGSEADAVATDDPAAALEAAVEGRSVLLFCTGRDAISEAGAACDRTGTTFMPASPWRFRPSNQAAVQSLRDGELGAPGLVRIHRWDADAVEAIAAETILPEVDLIHCVFDARHDSVHAARRGAHFLQVHFGFPGGGMAIADFVFGFPGSYESFSIIGSRGAAYSDDHRNMNLLFGPGPVRAIRTGQGDLHVRAVFREFIEAVRARRTPSVTAADARRSLDAAQSALDRAVNLEDRT